MGWWALPMGLLVGLTMGALGGGGAIIAVPALVHLMGLDIRTASSASLLVVALISATGIWPHHARRRVRWRDGAFFAVLGLLGNAAGTWAAGRVAGRALELAFAGLLLVVAVLMWQRSRPRGGAGLDGRSEPRRRGLGWLAGAATASGALTGFFGVGGGFAVVPALTLVLGFDAATAVGTSILVLGINALVALGLRAVAGGLVDLPWGLVATFAACAVVGGRVGGWLTARLSPALLQRIFAILLVVVAVSMAAAR